MEKKVMVDSDILSMYMKNYVNVVKNFEEYVDTNGFVYISRLTVLEILGGLKAKKATKQIADFRAVLKKHKILELTEVAVEISSDIFAELCKKGRHSGNYDILIAGIALANDLALCTNNQKDYENIEGLTLINWTLRMS